jgi:hypothetical protein
MSRSVASTIALVLLVGLSLTSWWLAEGSAGPALILTLAVVKAAIIGIVFLELYQAWFVWGLMAAALVGSAMLGVLLLM